MDATDNSEILNMTRYQSYGAVQTNPLTWTISGNSSTNVGSFKLNMPLCTASWRFCYTWQSWCTSALRT